MKNWLRRKLRTFLSEDIHAGSEKMNVAVASREEVQSDPVLNFKVFNAVGGKVVEFRTYDRRTDRNNCTTYIITNDQDFGERISKIATMENLKS